MELIEEYNKQLNNILKKDPNIDIQDFNFSIIVGKNNRINKLIADIIDKNEENLINDVNIIELIQIYKDIQKYNKEEDTDYQQKSYDNLKDKEYKTYTKEEEQEIFKKYTVGNIQIRNEIILHNLKLVKKIAKKFKTDFLSYDDIVDIGIFGLIKAIDKFDYTKGFKFSTYAIYWIYQVINREIMFKENNIKLSCNMYVKTQKYKRIYNQIYEETSKKPSIEQLSQKLNMSQQEIKEIEKNITKDISINSFVNDNCDTTFEELIEDESIIPINEKIEQNMINEEIIKIIEETFPKKREKEMLYMRFGFPPYNEPKRLEQIAKKYNLTRERVRQIINRDLRKLKVKLEEKNISDNNDSYESKKLINRR